MQDFVSKLGEWGWHLLRQWAFIQHFTVHLHFIRQHRVPIRTPSIAHVNTEQHGKDARHGMHVFHCVYAPACMYTRHVDTHTRARAGEQNLEQDIVRLTQHIVPHSRDEQYISLLQLHNTSPTAGVTIVYSPPPPPYTYTHTHTHTHTHTQVNSSGLKGCQVPIIRTF